VGSGTSVSVLQVAETLKSIYGSHSLINISGDFRKGDIRHNTADISLLKEIFNHRPHISFEQGLNDLATWVLDEVKTNPEILLTQGYEQSIDELKEANMIFQAKKEILHD
jgi:dTDP-L-rhamnose 4-epimerase